MTSPQDRIDQLLELKADSSTVAQMTYVDELATEMARYCHTQQQTYAAAELLDHVITELAWARLRLQATYKPHTGPLSAVNGPRLRPDETAPANPADGPKTP